MNTEAHTNRWLPATQTNPQVQLRLYCYPYAGGGKNIFRSWPEALPSDIELVPVQLPGRDSRIAEASFSQAELLVESLGQAVAPHLNFPFAFFGHSMGAVLCFELARYLRRHQLRMPLHLFVSGRRAPQ